MREFAREAEQRETSADFVTAFSTGRPAQAPHILVLSLTTPRAVADHA